MNGKIDDEVLSDKVLFADKKVFVDENGSEFVLTCRNETDRFDIDTIEDILDWDVRTRKEDN